MLLKIFVYKNIILYVYIKIKQSKRRLQAYIKNHNKINRYCSTTAVQMKQSKYTIQLYHGLQGTKKRAVTT